MIELVSTARCVGCSMCVKVCPTNVFDEGPDRIPVIARQNDCQTCFICEVYCPVDALYVSPYGDEAEIVDERELAESGVLGSWREKIGWGPGRVKLAKLDTTPFIDRVLPLQPPLDEEETAFILTPDYPRKPAG
ncbi:ferredoxin family protein [Paenibacillus chitinolyticus]|uniref:Ferredoxin family protein n=1 Tax=Paenibacillus chitinolyticus TaxID=79263 RepID=A0A410WRQ0_9BACL|nr:ferredoxin family protein [Paenibacillus chitinolyticus]MCY9593280.1 ferredoxin family protein [Paenibacillus chitinolyticus]MCY9598814.1 ferredoxin family protein [Paenibacillus chitinolyticus]QAV17021.1 ferredoxin family protein [Paenibacillus chitinolyticus]